MEMQDKERGAQKPRYISHTRGFEHTGVTQSCAASVEFEDRLMTKVFIKPMHNILVPIFLTEFHKTNARNANIKNGSNEA